jgi:Big-like domain-containing protein
VQEPFNPQWTPPRIPFRWGGCLALLILLSCPAFSQSITVTSPTASQTLSGTSFTFACSLSSLPNAASVEWFVNGVSQGIVWSAPWSLAWNTNNVYNSSAPWHGVYAVARDSLGNTLATSATVTFGVYNSYLLPSSSISCGTVTTSTPLSSAWSGTVTITVPFTGTNATHQKSLYALVDGDYRVFNQIDQTTTNWVISLNTAMFPNGSHIVTVLPRDEQAGTGTSDGYPFCQWEQPVTFSNGSGTSMELLVSPKEWVIAPGATQQLSPIIDNTDGTTKTASSPSYSSGNTAVCTINSSGLVTGVAYGTCPITATSGGYSRTIYGYVSSINVVPHFGSDGALHNTYVPGVSLWFASIFQVTPFTSFGDPFKTAAQYGSAYTQAGFNTYEGPAISGTNPWNTSQSAFQTALNSYIASETVPLATYNLFFHAITTSMVAGCGGATGLNCGSGSSLLYSGTRGICSTYATPCWTYLAQQWAATNRLLGFSGPDESDANFLYPNFGTGVIGSTGAPSSLTCSTTAPTTWNVAWPSPGPDFSGPQGFLIAGATTNSQLNTVIGGSSFYQIASGSLTSTGFAFTGPSCSSGNVTVNSSSDPGMSLQMFAFEWDNNNTDYVHNTDYATIPTLVHAGSAVITGPVRGLASAVSQKGWMGNCSSPASWGDYAEIYETANNVAYSHPEHSWVADYRSSTGITLGTNIRTFWGNMCSARAMLSISQGTPLDYGIQGSTVAVGAIAGSLVTFATPPNIPTLFTSISRATLSGSSNSYFNANVFIDDCPSSTTCDISLATPSATPANTAPGTVTFDDGSTFTNVTMVASSGILECLGGGTCSGPNMNLKQNQTFTWSGSGADAYYTSNTFRLRSCPVPSVCNNSQLFWREVPPSSQISGAASAVVYPDSSYTRGVNHNASESLGGLNWPFASVFYGAVLGVAGHRLYQAGADYTLGTLAGNGLLTFGSTINYSVQAGVSPIYGNGATTAIDTFWAVASANLLLQRFATTGYLFQPRFGAPDIGYNIESSLRKGPKGNLLLTLNLQDGPQTRTVDISNCAVSGQPTIRYTVNWQAITVSTLAAGVTSDTPTYPASGGVVYLCANNAANEYNPPTISARLADIPGATQIVVKYSHVPYELPETTNNVVNCGTGTCSLPVDRQIGPIYYRLYYLSSSGSVLAASDIQTL